MINRRPLARFEELAQQFFEGSLERVLGQELSATNVAVELLLKAEEANAAGNATSKYEIHLHPKDLDSLVTRQPDLVRELGRMVVAARADPVGSGQPAVLLHADSSLSRRQVRVEAVTSEQNSAGNTDVMRGISDDMIAGLLSTLDAFLIVEGQRHVPLDRPFLTIGRHVDNDIVLDHASVSRFHAQLRLRHGHFVLYDAGSQGGTTVNSQQIHEWVLRPGDLIYLSRRVALIYGEGLDNREQLPSMPGEEGQETAVIPPQEP